MPVTYNLLSVDVIKEVNRIPKAQIMLQDGSASQQMFEISNTTFFQPGAEIEIQLQDVTVFKGIVVKHRVKSDRQKNSVLIVDLEDAAIALARERKNAIFQNNTDNAVMKEIVGATTGLTAGTFAATKPTHVEMVQFYCTDWDFILSRAEANGLWVTVDDGTVGAIAPSLSGRPKHTFEYGISPINDFELEIDIRHQHGAIESTTWDIATQQLASPQAAAEVSPGQGKLKPADLAKAIGAAQCDLVLVNDLTPEEAKAWADAAMTKSRLSMFKGRFSSPGFADIKPGEMMEILGIGDRFNGTTLVTAIRHQVNNMGWKTEVQFGLSAAWFSQTPDIRDTPAAGLVPAINGLQVGIVDTYVDDPDGKLRVRVKVPALTKTTGKVKDGLVWARLLALDAGLASDGKGRGTCFRPEPNDEVILGFLNDDPRQAVILGAVYSEKNPTPWPVAEENSFKGIVSRENLKVYFNDKQKAIFIETPGQNRVILTDEDGAIYITDANNNQIVMDGNGIKLTSDADIAIEAKGSVTIKGEKVDVN